MFETKYNSAPCVKIWKLCKEKSCVCILSIRNIVWNLAFRLWLEDIVVMITVEARSSTSRTMGPRLGIPIEAWIYARNFSVLCEVLTIVPSPFMEFYQIRTNS